MAQGLDSPYIHDVAAKATAFKSAGYQWAGGYYFRSSGFKQRLDKPTTLTLSKSGIFSVAFWEDGLPIRASYFSLAQGHSDGATALQQAIEAGQPAGSVIYPAIDYDAIPADLPEILAYMKAFQYEVKQAGIMAGAYGSGLVLSAVTEAGYASHTALAGAKAWQGYSLWAHRANILQTVMDTSVLGVSVDLDVSDGAAGGFKVSPC